MSKSLSQPENKMGVMPINKLLITMALPMILSMLVQALYNIVDSICVSRVSEDALTAVSLAFPVQSLMIAISVGTGVGINALLSRSLGEKKPKEAGLAAQNGMFLALCSYLVFAVLGVAGSRLFFQMQNVSPEIAEYGTQYLFICLLFSFGLFFQITFERLLQSTGKTLYNMISQGIGALINIVLDPILIFGLFGFPKLEVMGAAIATVIGQIVGMCFAFYFNHKKNNEINVSMKGFRPNGSTIRRIYSVGIPSIIMQAIVSVMSFGMNSICLMFSSTAAAVFGIYFKLQSFVFMPIFGLNNGMVPIIAYNYGARNKKRITDTIKLALVISISIMLVGLLIFQLFSPQLLSMFKASDEMLRIGVPALRIISISFLFAGYSIIISTCFQALSKAVYSLWISIARQLLVILPSAYLLGNLFGENGIWIGFPLSEIVSLIMCTILYRKVYKTQIQPLA